MNARDWLLLAFLSFLWGGTFLLAKIAIVEVPPVTLALGRVGLAALALALFLLSIGRGFPRGRAVWLAFLGMGVLNNVLPFCLIFWGQAHLSAGFASILNGTTPFFAVIVAHFLTDDEKATPAKIVGCLIGFTGVAVMLAPGPLAVADLWPPATIALLLAALCYGFAGVFGRRFRRMGVDPLHAAFGQLAASSLVLALAAGLVDRPWNLPMPSAGALAAILALAVFCTALAYVVFFRILASAGATNLMLVTLLIPISAIMLGAVFLGERLAIAHGVGMLLIGLGLLAIDGRVHARISRQT